MTENLPTVTTGGAVVVRPTEAVQIDAVAATATGQVGTAVSVGPAHEMATLDQARSEALTKLYGRAVSDAVIFSGLEERQVVRLLPELAPFASEAHRAIQARDVGAMRRIADAICDRLTSKGVSRQRVEWLRDALRRGDADFERAFAGRRTGPRSAHESSAAGVDELRELERMMGDPASPYNYRGIDPLRRAEADRLQARARELYSRGVSSDAKRQGAPGGEEARIDELVKLMADPSSEYWRGPRSGALQLEYRDLIDVREQRQMRD